MTNRPMQALALAGALVCAAIAGCGGHAAKSGGAGAKSEPSALAKQGRFIFDETPKYAASYTGNTLSCSDCHLASGTASYSAPMIDMAGLFPMYNKRAGHMISLKNRIQECFSRSEAGAPPPLDSPQMLALVAYIDWLSRDGVKGQAYAGRGFKKIALLKGDPAAGAKVYQEQCAACHGVNGAGVPPILPALWGNGSYNDGAGMDNPDKMAAFVHENMPQNHPGTLTVQQAYDVAAYVHTKPRQKFNTAYKHY
ncbi:MAG: c-type cytochrome [Terracidiphilus sp.]